MSRYDYKEMANSIDFILKPLFQDWTAFKTALKAYDGISEEEKSSYTNIINGTGTFTDKEKEMKKLSTYKKVFKNVYPGLRTAQTEVLTVKPKKTNAEIVVLSKAIANDEAPADTLTTQELMFSATLTPSLEEKVAIYKAVVANTGMWQAHNNLAAILLELAMTGDASKLDEAATQLEIASNKDDNNSSIQANMGALKVLQKSYEEAYATLSEVRGNNEVNAKVSAMKGALEVRMAKYDEAKASFASASESDNVNFDKGLAYLLSGDYTQADAALSQVSNDDKASASYLLAVSAARQNNMEEVQKQLSSAIQENPALKEKALNDLEFANFTDAVNNAVK